MPTKRTPPVSETAIRIFMRMRRCPEEGDRWWDLHSKLARELGAHPSEWPCIQRPENPYPPEHGNYEWWERQRDPVCQERWRLLEEGARELRRRDREARKVAEPEAAE